MNLEAYRVLPATPAHAFGAGRCVHEGLERLVRVHRLLCLVLLVWTSSALAQPAWVALPADELRSQLATLDVAAQRQWLQDAYANQALLQANDAQLMAVLQTLDTRTLFFPVRQWLQRNPDYSYSMLRQERLPHDNILPTLPERMQVRYRHAPRAIYVLWQAGGARAGQEILYDAALDAKHVRTHAGGFISRLIFNVAIDGMLARTQSRHSVRAIGFQYLLDQLDTDLAKLKSLSVREQTTVRVVHDSGKRYLEFVFQTPGEPDFYAPTTRMQLDLQRPVVRLVESQDAEGQVFERTVFEQVSSQPLPADAFDPNNPQYRF